MYQLKPRSSVKTVQSVQKALRIIEALGNEAHPLTLTQLCEKIDLNMSTTYRILQTLRSSGFVHYDRDSNRYRLGLKIFKMGNAALYGLDFRAEARPLLEELVAKCNETANLAVLDEGEVVYIEQVESPNIMKMLARLGSRLPAYSTGGGKVLLAYLDEEELARYLRTRPLLPFTASTITSPQRLRDELALIRDRGYGVDREEMEPGVKCVAAPIQNYSGRVIAALSVSGPSSRIPDGYLDEVLAPLVKEYAGKISSKLGHKLSLV